jgi:hypothetical protein
MSTPADADYGNDLRFPFVLQGPNQSQSQRRQQCAATQLETSISVPELPMRRVNSLRAMDHMFAGTSSGMLFNAASFSAKPAPPNFPRAQPQNLPRGQSAYASNQMRYSMDTPSSARLVQDSSSFACIETPRSMVDSKEARAPVLPFLQDSPRRTSSAPIPMRRSRLNLQLPY